MLSGAARILHADRRNTMRNSHAILNSEAAKPLPALVLLFGWLLLAAPASAEIEMVAAPTDRGPVYHWWPKLVIPAGWHHDRNFSFYYSLNAIAPEGVSFDDAHTVMYAKAMYKPREPQVKSLKCSSTTIKRPFAPKLRAWKYMRPRRSPRPMANGCARLPSFRQRKATGSASLTVKKATST